MMSFPDTYILQTSAEIHELDLYLTPKMFQLYNTTTVESVLQETRFHYPGNAVVVTRVKNIICAKRGTYFKDKIYKEKIGRPAASKDCGLGGNCAS